MHSHRYLCRGPVSMGNKKKNNKICINKKNLPALTPDPINRGLEPIPMCMMPLWALLTPRCSAVVLWEEISPLLLGTLCSML